MKRRKIRAMQLDRVSSRRLIEPFTARKTVQRVDSRSRLIILFVGMVVSNAGSNLISLKYLFVAFRARARTKYTSTYHTRDYLYGMSRPSPWLASIESVSEMYYGDLLRAVSRRYQRKLPSLGYRLSSFSEYVATRSHKANGPRRH